MLSRIVALEKESLQHSDRLSALESARGQAGEGERKAWNKGYESACEDSYAYKRLAEVEAERDAAVRELESVKATADMRAGQISYLRDEQEKSARLRDAAVRVAAAAKSYDSNREVYPAFMQRVRELCALVGEEAKT